MTDRREPLSPAFLAALPRAAQERMAQVAELEEQLEERVRLVETRWSSAFCLARATFIRHLAERLPDDVEAEQALRLVHAEDLYLSCACATGVEGALQAFDEHCRGEIEAVLGRLKVPTAKAKDIVQGLYERLFVGAPGKTALVCQYSGRGNLRSWVRVACARDVLKTMQKESREVPVEGDVLAGLAEAQQDPELQYLRDLYQEEFRSAFRRALASLTSRQRTLLKLHFFKQMSVDDLGAMYRVHRATAARWLAAAREALAEQTRLVLRERLGISRDDWESLLRLVVSRLEVTFSSLVDE